MRDNDFSKYILDICTKSKKASRKLANLATNERNTVLYRIAAALRDKADFVIGENKKDLAVADKDGVTKAIRDRLLLNRERINGMASSVEDIARMEDPIGRIESMSIRPSGIRVGQMRVPIGVIAVIFESRPNVTTDIAALALKSGNAAILRGGRESINSNIALYSVIKEALNECSVPEDAVVLIDRTEHEAVTQLLKMNSYIDIVIPRGGESLIKMVTAESLIPVIKHDKGVCHTFIDKSASPEMAVDISVNAKFQRPGVCNAMETLLIHNDFSQKVRVLKALKEKGVELRGCERTIKLLPAEVGPASEQDWGDEYLDLILSVKIVDSMEEAIDHIHKYGSNHSEAIVTSDYGNAERFLREVDSSAVFVNSSTRFHDGGEFGLGAEIGISTQKLHARGAMGLLGLTCLKYVIYGSGQVRN
ncbi:MAG: glutamate-5-semialdehyde dehydrogenase [Spirochaetes bacterium]|nr:glutamate-5-semialdehyde dehydrogenase [Spirochaetota bacterium]